MSTQSGDLASPRLQLIDSQKRFHQEVGDYMKNTWQLADAGFDYNLVAVFGSQSTGKSTLLNRLFGTSFDVMDEHARQQTTKGIWLSKAPQHPTLVMDVEGTDGRERGEDQDFERKSSLFAVAVAEVIIVNMWEHMVGLYQGANMGLLKTVLEVNLSLFQKKGSPKTLMYFVIRDHIGRTPMESLTDTLRKDMERIWASLSKPDGLEDAKIEEFFDFAFTALPHKILLPDKFEEEAEILSKKFSDRNNSAYVFRNQYRKGIPADGFPRFAEDIWEQINNNRDLDLPSQQELLAQFRCDELSTVAFAAFSEGIKSIKSSVESGAIVDDLGAKLISERDLHRAKFDTQASRYHADVYHRKRAELTAKMHSAVHVLFVEQLRNVHKKAMAMLKQSLDFQLRARGAVFQDVVDHCVADTKKYFSSMVAASEISDAGWSAEEAERFLSDEMTQVVRTRRSEELDKMMHALEKTIQEKLDEPISAIMSAPSATTWSSVHEEFKSAMSDVCAAFDKKAAGFGLDASELQDKLNALRLQCLKQLKIKLAEQTTDSKLANRMKRKFEQKFRYDDAGVPRVWQPSDDIESAYKKARTEAERLLTIFTNVDLELGSVFDNPSDEVQEEVDALAQPLVTKTRLAEVRTRFQKEADVQFMEAKRSVVATTAHIPRWMIVVMVVLGWNEFMSVLSSPLYLITFIIVAAASYVVYLTGMAGPLLMVTSKAAGEVTRQLSAKLQDHKVGGKLGNLVQSISNSQHAHEENIEMKKTQ
ncbi:Dynamin-like GTPase that mediates homotypic ER fusion [Sorochytrium milnesiophthora]